MSREDLVRIAGKVIDVLGGGTFSVQLENGTVIPCKLSGRLRRFSIRVINGDRVTVGLSPFDPTHGLIVARDRLGPQGPPPTRR